VTASGATLYAMAMDVIGHGGILRELAALAASGDPPHALIFAGPEGTGRTILARHWAQLLSCERGSGARAGQPASLFGDDQPPPASGPVPCGVCRPCRHIAEGNHPDVIILGPGDTLCRPRASDSGHASHALSRDIRICQVRGVIELVARYPYEATNRVIVVEPSDKLSRDASHTILKTLEEPPGHTYFVLVTAAPEAMLETIISRCRRIDVPPVPRAEIEEGLLARGTEPALAARAASESRGRPARARAFAAKPDLMGDRERLLARCAKVASARLTERFTYAKDLHERWQRDRQPVLTELDAWEVFWEMNLRESAAPGRGRADGQAGFVDALKAVTRARADLQANVTPRGALELMLLCFPRVTLAESPGEESEEHA